MKSFVTALFSAIFLMMFVSPLQAETPLRLATTTSTDNSGLLKTLLPAFKEKTGYEVHVIAVGTGKALRMGRDGDVDVVLVHAPGAEQKFVDEGHGIDRQHVMYNDFVIVGSKQDPAQILGLKDVAQALGNIHQKSSNFVSRGDDSGTHKKERALWTAVNVSPNGVWYREAGQGMGKILQMASELQAYTLTDRGTWLAMQDKLDLEVLVEGDERLFNPYGIIAVNPKKYPDINYKGAKALIDWMVSAEAQQAINDFKVNGKQLFIGDANTRGEND